MSWHPETAREYARQAGTGRAAHATAVRLAYAVEAPSRVALSGGITERWARRLRRHAAAAPVRPEPCEGC